MANLYTKTKIFHYKEKIDSLPLEVAEIRPPLHIRIKPTNVCNHNCSYCAYRVSNLQLGKDMGQKDFIPRKKMLEIIEDVVDMGVEAVTFSGGGDPFCYPYLLDTVKALVKGKVKMASLTNGALLEGEIAEIFAEHGTWLRISIDGWNDKSYARYRNVPEGEFSKVIRNIKNFVRLYGNCYLGVSIIVNKENAPHLYNFMEDLIGLGVKSIKICPCIISNRGSENNAYHKSIFNAVKKQIHSIKEKFSDEAVEIFDAYHEQLETFKKQYDWCPYLQILPVIGADQNVYSCQDKAYNLEEGLIGSLKYVRFKDFWLSNKDKFFKINPKKNCNHHCVADGKNSLVWDYLHADREHLAFV